MTEGPQDKADMSTFQKISGWPLNIKAAGRSIQLIELRAYSQLRCCIQPTPGRVTPKTKQKRHGYGRVTAIRYIEYLKKLHHKAMKKSSAMISGG